MSDISQVFEVDDILRVSIVSQVEHHLYFPESFLFTFCTNVPYYVRVCAAVTITGSTARFKAGIDELIPMVQRKAVHISNDLGCPS